MATLAPGTALSTLVYYIRASSFGCRDFALSPNCVRFGPQRCAAANSVGSLALSLDKKKTSGYRRKKLRSAGEGGLVTEQEEARVEQELPSSEQQEPVSVPVSPSDILTMFFQADGILSEPGIPRVTKALQGADGVTDLNVQVVEGIATVEFRKQTTVQATGVASSLVEIMQGAGFKLQTLNLSFEDEEDVLV